MARLLMYVTLVLLVSVSTRALESPVYCSQVSQYFLPCMSYLGVMSSEPTSKCCNGIKELNEKAKRNNSSPGKICQCIEDIVYVTNIHFNASRIELLACKCDVHLSFPISNSMDCSKVN